MLSVDVIMVWDTAARRYDFAGLRRNSPYRLLTYGLLNYEEVAVNSIYSNVKVRRSDGGHARLPVV